ALAPDGRYVVMSQMHSGQTAREGWLICWPVAEHDFGSPPWSVAVPERYFGRPFFLPDGRFGFLEYEALPRIRRQHCLVLRSGKTGETEGESLPFDSSPDRDAVSPDCRWVAGTKGNRLTVWSRTDLTQPPRVLKNGPRNPFTDLAFQPFG